MIIGLHHAQITVPAGAEADARRFYCGVLGLAEVEKPAPLRHMGGFWLRVGDRDVHVRTEDGVDRRATKAHLAYEVTDVAWWREHLTAHGLAPQDSIPIDGFDRFEARDPFGNRVEFIGRVAGPRAPDATETV